MSRWRGHFERAMKDAVAEGRESLATRIETHLLSDDLESVFRVIAEETGRARTPVEPPNTGTGGVA